MVKSGLQEWLAPVWKGGGHGLLKSDEGAVRPLSAYAGMGGAGDEKAA